MVDVFRGQQPTGHQNREKNEADNHPDPTHTNEPASPDKRNPPSRVPQKKDSPNREKPTMGLLIEILPKIGIFPPPRTSGPGTGESPAPGVAAGLPRAPPPRPTGP
ncbi:MAG: hypothetical protein MK194_16825, partial [Roseibacillus sp.]|nr:hypothetical protein [Roseibacillus sp.]